MLHAATTTADLPRIPAPGTLSSRSSLNEHGGKSVISATDITQRGHWCNGGPGSRCNCWIAISNTTLPNSKLELSISRPQRLALTTPDSLTQESLGAATTRICGALCRSCSQTCTPLLNFRLQMSRYNKMRVALFQRSRSQLSDFFLPRIPLLSLSGGTYCHWPS